MSDDFGLRLATAVGATLMVVGMGAMMFIAYLFVRAGIRYWRGRLPK